MTEIAAVKIVFDRHEFNLQFRSFKNAKAVYDKIKEARSQASVEIMDDFSRQVTLSTSDITCVSVIDFNIAMGGDVEMSVAVARANAKIQQAAQNPSGVMLPQGPRLV